MTCLQHLNKCDREIEVGLISANQTEGEEEANWENSSKVDLASHFHCLSSINQGCGPAQNLCHECRKKHVPRRENNCCQMLEFEEEDFRGLHTKPWYQCVSFRCDQRQNIEFYSLKPIVSRRYLLNKMTPPLKPIHALCALTFVLGRNRS